MKAGAQQLHTLFYGTEVLCKYYEINRFLYALVFLLSLEHCE